MEILKLVCAFFMLLASVQGVPDYRDSSEEDIILDEDIGSNGNEAILSRVEGNDGDAFLDLVAWSINWYEGLKGHIRIKNGFDWNATALDDNATDTTTNRTYLLNYPYIQLQPEIYLPKELSTIAVLQALKLTGQRIQVSHVNIMLPQAFEKFTCHGIYCQIPDDYIQETKLHLSKTFHVDKFPSHSALVDATIEVVQNVPISGMMKNHGSWKSVSEAYDKVYRSIMRVLEDEEFVSRNTKGDLYTYSKKYLDIVLNLVKEDLEKSAVSPDAANLTTTETDKEKADDANNTASMTKAWFKVYHFPTELSWENIKLALKTTFSECMADGIIPKLNWEKPYGGILKFMIPFMGDVPDIATLEETDDKGGMKRLPSALTRAIIDFIDESTNGGDMV